MGKEMDTGLARQRTAPPFSGRFATAMWDFSWLTRRQGDEAEYARWEQVLDQLADRGYGNVRIDAFPHLVAPAADGSHPAGGVFTLLPQRPRFMWGNHTAVNAAPAPALVAFVAACRDRGLTVGLSSWFIDDALHRRDEIRTPADFARAWSAVLALLDDAGLLATVAWVDLCNEFPLDLWAPATAREVFGRAHRSAAGVALRALPWQQDAAARVEAYFAGAIEPLRARWPGLRYCFSFHDLAGAQLRKLDVSAFDLAEPHCWLTDDTSWTARTLQVGALLEWPGGVRAHALAVGSPGRRRLLDWRDRVLRPRMANWRAWAAAAGLPLVTTEGWGPTNYADLTANGEEWRWVRQFAELAVEEAVAQGWTGICTANFAQPHHRGFWADPGWHRELTARIRGA